MAAIQSMIDLHRYIAKRKNMHNFDEAVMNSLRLITASGQPGDPAANPPSRPSAHPSCLLEIDITASFGNLNEVVHGGAAATIYDMTTTMALCPIQRSRNPGHPGEPGYWDFMGGVTRTLNVSYVKAIPVPSTIRIRNWVVQHGRTSCLIRGQMESVDGKTVYSTCEQHKINTGMSAEHEQFRREMWEERSHLQDRTKAKL